MDCRDTWEGGTPKMEKMNEEGNIVELLTNDEGMQRGWRALPIQVRSESDRQGTKCTALGAEKAKVYRVVKAG